MDQCYENLTEQTWKINSEENIFVFRNWKATFRDRTEENTVRKYTLVKGAEEDSFIKFNIQHKLVKRNTMYQHHPKRWYTWITQGDIGRAQINYILVRERFKNQVKDSRSYPGADVVSDHNLVMMHWGLKLNGLKIKERKQWDILRLKDENIWQK